MPGDGRALTNEFTIENDVGTLSAGEKQKIKITFIPCFPQVYDMVLVVDLEGVGQDMLSVPIKAECLVPKVTVTPTDFLDFGKCFLRHPKTLDIKIENDDFLPAKFEVIPQDEQSKRIAVYKAD